MSQTSAERADGRLAIPVEGPARPVVSVIVPVRNEIQTIDRCLAALVDQDYPRERMEILVVDGMSDDGTPDAVRRRAATAPHIRLLANPRRFAASAMNVGIAAARGSIIARVDGHAIVPEHFISACVAALAAHPDVECVSGATRTLGTGPTGRAIAAAMCSRIGVGPVRFRLGARSACMVDTVQFPVYRRGALERVGVFDEELVRNQDDELNLRLRRAGGKILMLPDADVVYFCRPSLRALWRQYREYGFWKIRVMQKHGGPSSWRHLVPGALVALLAAVPLVLVPGVGRLVEAALAAYAALIVVASGLLAVDSGLALWPRIAAALVTLHVAYGVGFWEGVVAFGVPRPGRSTAPCVAPGIPTRAGA